MKKYLSLLLALIMILCLLSGCSRSSAPDGSTLVFGSGDYDSINPIMNEHCEIICRNSPT